MQLHAKYYDFHDNVWSNIYKAILDNSRVATVRGLTMYEVNDVEYTMYDSQNICTSAVRDMSFDYLRREFLWYLGGDKYDLRIAKYAPLWKKCINNGVINSNYGQYLFANDQFYKALDHLYEDNNTRRCWIPFFQGHHQDGYPHNDYPCTTGIGFRIVENELEMVVHMRSQDAWHGMPYDCGVAFFLQNMALYYLNHNYLKRGKIVHKIDNLHFYERHVLKAMELVKRKSVSDAATGHIPKIMGILHSPHAFIEWLRNIDGDFGENDNTSTYNDVYNAIYRKRELK